jgi:hypothetical protein
MIEENSNIVLNSRFRLEDELKIEPSLWRRYKKNKSSQEKGRKELEN